MTTIESLEIKNFQRVSAVKIEPTGSLILLMGKNSQGKTSILDAIQTALEGYNARSTPRPIRDGAGRAVIDIGFTDSTEVHRKFLPGSRELVAADGEGNKWGQKDLDGALSSLGVDASAFTKVGEKKQLEILLSIVKLPFVPAELDAEAKQVDDARRLIGQQEKAIGAVILDASMDTEETSAGDLIKQIQAARDEYARQGVNRDRAANCAWEVDRLEKELVIARAECKDAHDLVDEHGPLPDPLALEAQLATVEESNARIRANNEAFKQMKAKEALAAEYHAHTARLEAIKKKKKDGLAKAKMPIEGLSFDEEGVLYQGKPFTAASGSEALIVSAAMIIATNPKIRTMVIRDGNIMDQRSLGILQAMLEANEFQAFVEIVSDTDQGEFRVIEGELVLGDAA